MIVSPKLHQTNDGFGSWYRYYAGFSPLFARNLLELLDIRGLVLDPWNGFGTTTFVAKTAGVPALGYDLNPASVLIARSRLIDSSDRAALDDAGSRIRDLASAPAAREGSLANEPVLRWFGPETALRIRALQTSIDRELNQELTENTELSRVNEYFSRTFRSLKALSRSASPGTVFAIVVQDSYYEEIHNDLPRIFHEMLCNLGWAERLSERFAVGDTLAGINKATRRYRSDFDAVEVVRVFERTTPVPRQEWMATSSEACVP